MNRRSNIRPCKLALRSSFIIHHSSFLLLVLLLACGALADEKPLPAGSLVIKCAKAQLWDQGDTSVAELSGPVTFELDHTKMSADNAVVWILPNPDGPADSHRVQIALIG